MNTEDMIDTDNLTFRSATPDDVDFVAWCNYKASSPAPGFCWWDPLIEGFGIETITFIRQAVALDVLAWCRIADFVIVERGSIPVAGAGQPQNGYINRSAFNHTSPTSASITTVCSPGPQSSGSVYEP